MSRDPVERWLTVAAWIAIGFVALALLGVASWFLVLTAAVPGR
jgi:hypothetical protein